MMWCILLQFIEMFNEAKLAARELMKERQMTTQRLQDQDKPHPPSGSSPSPTSPPIKSPNVISPPVSTSSSTSKSPSPSSLTSPGPYTTSGGVASEGPPGVAASEGPPGVVASEGLPPASTERETDKVVKNGRKESKNSREEPVVNGNQSLQLEPLKISNGHSTSGEVSGL